jgi:hypothetical protein
VDTIKDIISRVMGPMASGQGGQDGIAGQWQRLSGNSKTSSVAGCKDGVLTVHVDCAARVMKLNLDKERFIQEMSKNHPEIKNIKFKVGRI